MAGPVNGSYRLNPPVRRIKRAETVENQVFQAHLSTIQPLPPLELTALKAINNTHERIKVMQTAFQGDALIPTNDFRPGPVIPNVEYQALLLLEQRRLTIEAQLKQLENT